MRLNLFGSRRKPAWDREDEPHTVSTLPSRALFEVEVKRILVAVDFSAGSRQALEYAAALARKLQAEVVLLHVFEGVPGELKILESTFVDTSFREEAQANLAEWQKMLGAAGVSGKTVFRDGAAVDCEIARVAEETGADLLVMGRSGRQGLDRVFIGNIVAEVLRQAACPVLVA